MKRQYQNEHHRNAFVSSSSSEEEKDPYDKIDDGGYTKYLADADLERRIEYEPREHVPLTEFIVLTKRKRNRNKNAKK